MPKISVILPTYNCDPYIKDCLDSILNQTFSDFEVLIIDDCSTDQTVAYIKSYSDPRIRLRVKETNTGYTDSLNWGIQNAQGIYIARMDGDDICHLERFERQVHFLDSHLDVGLVGTQAQVINGSFVYQYPSSPDKIMTTLLFGNACTHPSVMGRIELFKKYPYDRTKEPAEDYDLWTRMVQTSTISNIDEILLYYRHHEGQVSITRVNRQEESARQSMLRMFKMLAYDDTFYEDHFVKNAIWPHKSISLEELSKVDIWYKSLKDTKSIFNPILLKSALSRKRYNVYTYALKRASNTKEKAAITAKFIKEFPSLGSKFTLKRILNR